MNNLCPYCDNPIIFDAEIGQLYCMAERCQ